MELEPRPPGNDRMNPHRCVSLRVAVMVATVCAVLPALAPFGSRALGPAPAMEAPPDAAPPGLLSPALPRPPVSPVLLEGSRSAGNDAAASGADGFLRSLLEAGREEPEFLPPEVAFVVDASVPEPQRAVVRWRVEPGYYLYAERIEVRLAERSPPGVSLVGVDLPPGETREDPYFGTVEVYRTEVATDVRLAYAQPPPEGVVLQVAYQGCADAGLCYPPIRKELALRLDGSGSSGGGANPLGSSSLGVSPASPVDGSGSETDRIAWRLATEGLAASLAVFFGFGVLLSLTPCIFPMIPILSSLLVAGGRPDRGHGFTISFAYVLGSAVTWAAVGGIAGLLGANLPAALQSPWSLVVVSAAFVVFALSMFGLFIIGLPSAWTTRAAGWTNRASRVRGYTGAGLMGAVSALVVGPCVAAPMAGAVLYIGQAGDALRGGLALFAMGFGMGLPLLVLGASSERLLPRAGPWMDTIQRVAGVAMLGVAAYLLSRVLPPQVAMVAWAVVALSACVVLVGAARRMAGTAARGPRLAAGGGAAAAAAYAAIVLLGASTGAHDPLRPLAGLLQSSDAAAVGSEPLRFVSIKGLDGPDGLEAALTRAAATGRFVMLDFYADWCVSCKEMEDSTFRDPRVLAALEGVVILRADVTRNDEADQALMKELGVLGPPAILFFGPDRVERRRYRTVGFKDATQFSGQVTGATNAA